MLHDDGEIKVYQLDAATEGSSTLQAPVVITALIKKLTTSLDKEYQGKHITYQSRLDPTLTLSADEGNMNELFGNLLENAYKYCGIRVSTEIITDEESIRFYIDNDGKEIPKSAQKDILKCGKRMGTQTEGQGLGLAIACDIVDAYQGTIKIRSSKLGGCLLYYFASKTLNHHVSTWHVCKYLNNKRADFGLLLSFASLAAFLTN